jgi:hypothetical protein
MTYTLLHDQSMGDDPLSRFILLFYHVRMLDLDSKAAISVSLWTIGG